MKNAYKLSHAFKVGLVVFIFLPFALQAQDTAPYVLASITNTNVAPMLYGSASSSPDSTSNEIQQAVETGLPVARKRDDATGSTLARSKTFAPNPNGKTASDSKTQPANATRKGTHSIYPWKSNIITTIFWIGEGGSSVSSTQNIDSAWQENWRGQFGGSNDPSKMKGYLPAHHAATCNPFYVALPFNDLAYPDKAKEWVPKSWAHPYRRGEKPVSACQGRWLEIKRPGHPSCFAQWEDVGPIRTDHAEYVFGDARPTTLYTKAGLDISPAVAKYLGMDEDHTALTSWRFVDDDDVPSGDWLKYGEQAILLTVMRDINFRPAPIPTEQSVTPKATTPEESKKKISASKG